jgi:hypothetical protein
MPGATGKSVASLAEHRKIHGHCNAPIRYYRKNIQLGTWVMTPKEPIQVAPKERNRLMTTSRIQVNWMLGFEWDSLGAAWEGRLRSLPTIAKFTVTAMFLNPQRKHPVG